MDICGPIHPCYLGLKDDYDHDLECIDDSFDHEYGTEVIRYMQCKVCSAEPDINPNDYYYDGSDFYEY